MRKEWIVDAAGHARLVEVPVFEPAAEGVIKIAVDAIAGAIDEAQAAGFRAMPDEIEALARVAALRGVQLGRRRVEQRLDAAEQNSRPNGARKGIPMKTKTQPAPPVDKRTAQLGAIARAHAMLNYPIHVTPEDLAAASPPRTAMPPGVITYAMPSGPAYYVEDSSNVEGLALALARRAS
jgi:hypothetical protein